MIKFLCRYVVETSRKLEVCPNSQVLKLFCLQLHFIKWNLRHLIHILQCTPSLFNLLSDPFKSTSSAPFVILFHFILFILPWVSFICEMRETLLSSIFKQCRTLYRGTNLVFLLFYKAFWTAFLLKSATQVPLHSCEHQFDSL